MYCWKRRNINQKILLHCLKWVITWICTLPVMTMQPSWSIMRTSSWEGGWQNFCCRIWRIGSITLGVSRNATAIWPKALIVWSGIKWASLLKEVKKKMNQLLYFSSVYLITVPMVRPSLIILLIDVKTVRKTCKKCFYDDIIHGQSCFETPTTNWKIWVDSALDKLKYMWFCKYELNIY